MGITCRHRGMFTHGTFFATGPDDSAPGLTSFWRQILARAKIFPKTFEVLNYHCMEWKRSWCPLLSECLRRFRAKLYWKQARFLIILWEHILVTLQRRVPRSQRQLSPHKQVLLAITRKQRQVTVMKWPKISPSYNRVWVHTKITSS